MGLELREQTWSRGTHVWKASLSQVTEGLSVGEKRRSQGGDGPGLQVLRGPEGTRLAVFFTEPPALSIKTHSWFRERQAQHLNGHTGLTGVAQ